MNEKRMIRKKSFYLWLVILAIILTLYIINKEWFDISFLKRFVKDHKFFVVAVYLTILTFIGLTFLPSTPFAIAGLLFFPVVEAYIINMAGIITSTVIVYYFTQYLGLDKWIEMKFPQQIEKTKKALRKKELPIITAWSFFPVVPTDLIIYVSSSLRVSFLKCVIGVLIGEGILNAMYIFSVGFFIVD
ncbi:MAG TPA: TVP38/TMEM64 family protein [Bacteroidales bacterium]|nr:TVP38/TMEM64 family protein [Bacteroidales bacterium]